ncbi:MAG: alanine racemase [Candidatus Binatia bacterium]
MHEIQGRPTVAEVSLSALRANLRQAREVVGPRVAVLAVVKADAYGHGAVAAARAFCEAGASGLGVSMVGEALELRRAGIDVPIVVLGGTFAGEEDAVVAHDLATAVWSIDAARALSARAAAAGRTVAVHVKVNTGMTRLGLDVEDVHAFAEALAALPSLVVDGVFSHFASADDVETVPARAQVARFEAAVGALALAGIRPPHVHIANSAGVLSAPEAHFSMVRPGIMLYGYSPAWHLAERARLTPAMTFRTRVVQARSIDAGTRVGYGGRWKARRPSRIAVLPAGYADGYHRLNTNRAQVLVCGRRARVAGRVCMDHTMVDVTDVGDVGAGEAVVLFGRQGDAVLGADEVAEWCETISYEVLTAVGKRVPRRYVEEFGDA